QFLGISKTVAATEAMEVARENLRADFTDTEWAALWTAGDGCPTSAPSGYTFATGTNCIMFNNAGTRVRVRIPDQVMETVFAKVLGEDEIRASAQAEAQISYGGLSGVLPFGILSGDGSGQEACLKASANGHDGTLPCAGPDSGNFGSLDAPFYGNAGWGTSAMCSGNTNNRLVANIVKGIDHGLDEYRETASSFDTTATAGPSEPSRNDECNETPSPGFYPWRPNTLVTQTGVGSNLHEALLETDDAPYVGGNARLRRTSGLTGWDSSDTRDVVGESGVDNKPLWEFLDPSLTTTTAPAECLPSYYVSSPSKDKMKACFAAYNSGPYSEPIFTDDILLSPRFSFIPEFHASSFGSGTSYLPIKRFRLAFIQTLYFSCSGGSSCDIIFNPGESGTGLPGAANKTVDSMTAMIFKDSMLPDDVVSSGPGGTLNGAKIGLIR
ncbi:MAG: hypothetical protein ACRDYV_12110, partial [Acidimicrobiia bacterium]